jgi:phosphoglycerate dehydrogenase-like enzyme
MRIAILDDFNNLAHQFGNWTSLAPAEVVFFDDHLEDQAALLARLKDFDAVGLMRERTPMPRELMAQLPQLKCIITTGKVNAAIDLVAAKELGIMVCGTNSPGHATAELAFLLVMAQARQLLPNAVDLQQQGRWQTQLGQDCRGKTLGILGLGRLGSQVAKLGQTIGMQVVAWSQNLTSEACAAQGVAYVDKATLFERSDFISIHLRLSERSRSLVGAPELAALGPTGYLVNTSRAEIVDQDALLAALDAQILGGVATDVYVNEPANHANERLIGHPRALCTPHLGYVTRETYEVFYTEMVEGLGAWLKGAPVRVLNA